MLWHNTCKISKKSRKGFNPLERTKIKFLTGFTFVEVMIATAIMAIGSVMIHETFFRSLDLASYSYNYLTFSSKLDEELWQAQELIARVGSLDSKNTNGLIDNQGKQCAWSISFRLIDGNVFQQLYKIDLRASWNEGKRKINYKRTTFSIYEE